LWLLVSFHPVVGASLITYISLPYPFPFWVALNKKAKRSWGYCIVGRP